MQARSMFFICLLLLATAPSTHGVKTDANPIGKVLDLLSALATKVAADGENAATAYKDYYDWCEDEVRSIKQEIETATALKEELEATINKAVADIQNGETKIDELAGAVASGKADLSSATIVRQKEVAEFDASESELSKVVDTLTRAINILEREMQKNPAALVQVDTANLQELLQALTVVMDAASFGQTDRQKLLALVQSRANAEADDEEFGAPAPAAYKSHGGSIVEVIEDMREKAEAQLAELRKSEANSKHNHNMLKQSLEAQAEADEKDLAEQKAGKAAAEEAKATADGNLGATNKQIAVAQELLEKTREGCMQVAKDYDVTLAGRAEELKALAQATKILKASTGGAAGQSYSFLQTGSSSRSSEIVGMVKRLAEKQHSIALEQLASRIATVLRYSTSGGDDPFVKVKGLIQAMIEQLMHEAEEEADEKAYCDEEMAKTEEKKGDFEDTVSKLTVTIDQAAADSTKLKEQVKVLQSELSKLAKLQASMDQARVETHTAYVAAKADLEQGLNGVRKAIEVLGNFYGAGAGEEAALLQDDSKFSAFMQQPKAPQQFEKSGGAGGGIIGILQVVESDFATNLAEEETEEADAQASYEKMTQENKITGAEKEQDVKYKTQEFTGLDKSIAELSSDRDSANTELSAVLEYYGKLRSRCIAKPETYEERKRRREAEIAGLKEALAILEGEAVFAQRSLRGKETGSSRRSLLA